MNVNAQDLLNERTRGFGLIDFRTIDRIEQQTQFSFFLFLFLTLILVKPFDDVCNIINDSIART